MSLVALVACSDDPDNNDTTDAGADAAMDTNEDDAAADADAADEDADATVEDTESDGADTSDAADDTDTTDTTDDTPDTSDTDDEALMFACDGSTEVTLSDDGATTTVTGNTDNADATITSPEDCQSDFTQEHRDEIYTFEAPSDGTVYAELSELGGSGSFLTVYAVAGECQTPPTGLGCGGTDKNFIEFDVTTGESYTVVVDGHDDASGGEYELNLGYEQSPSNETCASAEAITVPEDGSAVTVEGNTIEATDDLSGSASCHTDQEQSPAHRDLVYEFEAPIDGTVEAQVVQGSSWDASLYALEGSCGSTSVMECQSFSDPLIAFDVTAGETYRLVVDGFATTDAGSFELSVEYRGVGSLTQPGEACAAAVQLQQPAPGNSATYSLDLASLADDYDGDCLTGGDANGTDGVYQIAVSDAKQIDVHAEGADTVLYIYEDSCPASSDLTCSESTSQSGYFETNVSFTPDTSKTYYLVVDLWAGFSSQFRTDVELTLTTAQ